jgi:prophage regulatory protein
MRTNPDNTVKGSVRPTRKLQLQPLEILNTPNALMRRNLVEAVTGMGKSAIYAAVRDKKLAAPLKFSSRCVRWRSDDVRAFMDLRGGA